VSIIFLLIPLGLALLAIAVWAFVWAVNHDQFDDLERAAHSILFEEEDAVGGTSAATPGDPAEPATHEVDERRD
jgi:cbb3-type cytochrome oxidase maturation protein